MDNKENGSDHLFRQTHAHPPPQLPPTSHTHTLKTGPDTHLLFDPMCLRRITQDIWRRFFGSTGRFARSDHYSSNRSQELRSKKKQTKSNTEYTHPPTFRRVARPSLTDSRTTRELCAYVTTHTLRLRPGTLLRGLRQSAIACVFDFFLVCVRLHASARLLNGDTHNLKDNVGIVHTSRLSFAYTRVLNTIGESDAGSPGAQGS